MHVGVHENSEHRATKQSGRAVGFKWFPMHLTYYNRKSRRPWHAILTVLRRDVLKTFPIKPTLAALPSVLGTPIS